MIRNLPVQPRGRLTSDTCENLVRELVKHLLYMRNQIPGLYEDLDWQVQARSKRGSCLLPGNEQFVTENFVGYKDLWQFDAADSCRSMSTSESCKLKIPDLHSLNIKQTVCNMQTCSLVC